MIPATERTKALRQRILNQSEIEQRHPRILWSQAWQASGDEPWTLLRRAQCTTAVLDKLPLACWPESLLAGQFPDEPPSAELLADLERWQEQIAPATPRVDGQRAHMAIDYELLLRQGLGGIREQIARYRKPLDLARPDHLEKDVFYLACDMCLRALARYSQRYATHLRASADDSNDSDTQAMWRRLADICDRVPENPASTFYEAVQAIHLTTFALCASQQMLLFQLGRPDRYLLPYYRADLSAGRITPQEAQELIDCLCLMLNAYTPRGLAVGFMVGGLDGGGAEVSNELTRMMIESISHTRLSYPGIGLCWSDDLPKDIARRATELLAEGLSHPALFNDATITAGMAQAGLPPAEACLYQNSTCVEITPVASSNVYVASPYVNLLQLLHDVIGLESLDDAGHPVATDWAAPAQEVDSLDDLLAVYLAHLDEAIAAAVIDQNTAQMTRRYNGGWPLLSCFVNDCLARGLDIDHGGARHNWIEPSFVGLANTIDAMTAIDTLVFREKRFSLAEMVDRLRADPLDAQFQRLLLNHPAKYGNDEDGVDRLATRITTHIASQCQKHQTYLGGAFHPGFFCWVMHERLGVLTASSPDGRLARAALGDGSGPAQGRERLGPTAAILSATKWDHRPMLGGIAVNLRFQSPKDKSALSESLLGLVRTFMARGGFELQVNVVDTETLRKAQTHPEDFRDLVVRIGGYSDYFVGLSPRMQQEIILRTEHASN